MIIWNQGTLSNLNTWMIINRIIIDPTPACTSQHVGSVIIANPPSDTGRYCAHFKMRALRLRD